MSSPSLTIRIGADASGATREIHNTTQNIQNLGSQVNNTTSHVNHYNTIINNMANESNHAANSTRNLSSATNGLYSGLQSVIALIGGGMLFKSAVQEMASFETKLLSLKALTMANTEQMKQMETQARQLGATTAFSAQQAAEAQGVLASAGLKTNEILSATPQILQLAAAGSLDLSKAAEFATGTMQGLGLGLGDLQRIGDVFARAAADSSTSVEQIGDAMKTAAPIARLYKVSLEELAAMLEIAANNQIKGAEAGNNLKTLFKALGNDAKPNIEILDKHNLKLKDLAVESVGATKVLENLKNAHFSAAEAAVIYGGDATALGAVLASNADKFKTTTGELKNANGSMSEMSDILNQGLAKAWDALKGSLSEAALQLGENGVKGALTDVIQEATGVISIYEGLGEKFKESNKLTEEQYGHLKDVASALRSFGGAVGGVTLLATALWGLRAAQIAFNTAAAMNPYIAGATVLAAGVGYVNEQMNAYNDRQKGHLKEVKTLEEANLNVQKQQLAVKNLTAIGGNEKAIGIAKTQLDALKKQRDAFQSTLARPVGDIVNETNQWLDDLDGKKPPPPKPPFGGSDDTGEKLKLKKGLSDAQREANKAERERQQLIEKFQGKDPYQDYAKSMAELKSVQDALKPETFLLNEQKIAAEFEKNTVDLKAYNDELERHKKYLNNVDDYNSTIDELTRNKNRGAITQGEYGLGVAQANAGLMNQVTDKQVPVAQVGEVIDSKNSLESEKLLNAQLEKSKELLKGIKDTGAGAFDGLLGGISAVSSAFTSMGETLESISAKQTENLTKYTDYLNSAGATQDGITQSTKTFYDTKDALSEKSQSAELSGVRQVAGASSKMFAEQSAGRKIMHTLEMTFGVIEMAMTAKKIVMNGIEAITNQGKGDPYSAFPRMAAMAAIVAALGVGIAASVSGGSNQTSYSGTYADMSPTKSTGTVLGDNSANSKSIKSVTDLLNDIHAKEYPELKGINDAMKEFGKTIVNFITGVAKATNSFTDMTFGVQQLEQPKNTMANMPFIGSLFTKTTVEKIGEGMIIAAFNPLEEGMQLGLQSYSTFKITKKGLFGSSTKIQEIYGDVPAAIESELTDLFGYMGKTVMNSLVSMDLVKLLGVSLPNFQLGTQKWDWFKSDNKQDYFNNMINATADRIATVSQFIIGDFQKLGEGLYETLNRMAIQQGVVINKYRKMGFEFDSLVTTLDDGTTIGSLGMAALSDSLVNMYNSTADAKDGLKNFISAMDSLYNLTTSKGAQSQNAIKGIATYFKDEGFDQAKMFDKSYIQAQLDAKKAEIKAAQENAANKYQDVAKFGDYVGNAFTPKSLTDLETTLDPVFKNIINKGRYANATWSDLGSGWTKEMIMGHAGQNDKWDEIIRVLDENTKNQAAGLAGLNGAYSSKEEFDAAKKVVQDLLDAANITVTDLTNSIGVFDEQLNKTIPKITGLQSTYLDIVETSTQSTERKRKEIIDAEFKGMTEDLAKQDVFKPIITAMGLLDKGIVVTAADIQQFVWKTEDAAKSVKKLADATKYFDGFTRSIKDWIQNLKTTQLGSPESQFNAAKDNFAAQMKIINGGLATSAEEKQAALSGITGVADTYIAAIKNNYASTEKGQELIAQVVEQISGLTTNVDVQQLQLGVLQQIRDGVHDIPTGISDTQKEFFTSLATKIDSAQKTYISAPTSTNDLIANTLAKEWTMAVDYATKGSGFLDAFIKSFDGKTGLNAAVNLIFDDKSLNATQAQTAIDNVLSKVISLVNIEVVPRFLTTVAQREIDQQIALLNPPPIYLNIDTTSAVSVIKSVTDTATDAIKAINNLDALGSLTAINPSIYNASEMRQTVTPQLMQSSPFAVEPKIGGGIPADSSILKRLSSIDTARNSNSGNSSSDAKETVEELKKQTAELTELVKQTTALLRLQIAANQELVEKMNSMDESLKTTAKKTRLSAVSGAK